MRGNARAFGSCGELHPDDLFRHVFATSERAETAIRSGDHPLPVTDHRHSLPEPPSDKFGMLDKIRGGVENAGHQQHVWRQRVIAQCVVFVLMPGIGELDRECPDIGTVQLGQDGRHRNVMDMRPVTVAPADVEPDALAGDALDPQIDSRGMQFELPEEFSFPHMREKPMSLHRQIRGVALKDHASVVDRAILVGQRFRESHQNAAHRAEWTSSIHARQWTATLATYVYPLIGDLPVSAVDSRMVMRVLEPHWATKRETMSRVCGRIEAILGWATTQQYREGENPARWRGHLANLLAKGARKAPIEHYEALPYREIPAFMAQLRALEGILARSLEFLILTAARTDEVRLAPWTEVDLERRVWVVPSERMKLGREHRVPLSGRAVEILQSLPRHSPYIFPGRSLAFAPNMKWGLLRKKMGVETTVHGFRSTFADWAAEQTDFPSEVREMALAHAVGDRVEAAYRRGDLFDKRRQLAEAWAHYCEGEEPAESKVVRLAGRAG